MGNKSSKYGGMEIILDKYSVFPGDTISGKIAIDIKKDFPAESLILRVKGGETSHREYKRAIMGGQADHLLMGYSDEVEDLSEPIFVEEESIHTFDNKEIAKGHYIFPFRFTVPLNCLPTVIVESYEYLAKIEYLVQAFFKNSEGEILNDVVSQQHFGIQNVLPESEMIGPINQNIWLKRFFGTCSAGVCRLTASLPKGCYNWDDTIILTLGLDNSGCKRGIREVKIKLSMIGYSQGVSIEETDLVSQKLESVKAGENLEPKGYKFNLKEVEKTHLWDKYDSMLSKSQNEYRKKLQGSVSGEMVNMTYYISILIYPEKAYCAQKDDYCDIPIEIQGAPYPDVKSPREPKGWDPETYDEFTLILPEDIGNKEDNYEKELIKINDIGVERKGL